LGAFLGIPESLARTPAGTAAKALSAKAHQGHKNGAQMIALQASGELANDSGLCALKNVTVDSFTLDETIGIARGLEEKLADEAVRLGAAQKVHHLDADILRTRTRDGRGH
jgi:hypothetical protein